MNQDLYAVPVELPTWQVGTPGTATFSWDYDEGRAHLLSLYQKGKSKQWDQELRIDWSVDTDPDDPLGLPEFMTPLYGSALWAKLGRREKEELKRHAAAWQISQFLHGEQGAMICSSRLVESVPTLDAKFYAATQVMDEARHAELFTRYVREHIGLAYPMNRSLQQLLDDTLSDSRWDIPYLGMQVLIEGLALASFGVLRDLTKAPLPKQILAYVMQDEARHVAFGRMALREYYAELSDKELHEREDFVIDGCYLMRDRFRWCDVIENLGYSRPSSGDTLPNREALQLFQRVLFSRIVPCVRDIGLWTERVRAAFADIGVLEMAETNLETLMRRDEEIADQLDAQRFAAEAQTRADEVAATIHAGEASRDEVR